MMKKTARGLLAAVFFVFLVLIDQIIKRLSLFYVGIGTSFLLGSFGGISFSLTLTTNEGAAWGIFAGHPWFLLGIRLFFISLVLFFYVRSSVSFLSRLALLSILAGAIGNIIDTFVLGYVIDMIHVVFWGWEYPVFNFADICIFLGCLGVIWESAKKEV